MPTQKTGRNTSYDLLRFVGISGIILAHMGVPGIVFQARNFDVPLMVLLSGVSFSQFSSKSYSSYKKYLYSRFLRLLLPTWLFLIFYNFVSYAGSNELPTAKNIVFQVTLIGGSDIGIWIIRIFLSMAIIAPFLHLINSNIKRDRTFYLLIATTYILYELSFGYAKLLFSEVFLKTANILFFFTISYGLVFLYGLRINSFNKKTLEVHILISGIIFSSYCFGLFYANNVFIPTQRFKYPPQIYYLSFSLFISICLFYLVKFRYIKMDGLNFVQFIGRSTLWIYLWHWFFIKLYQYFKIDFEFVYKYLLIYFMTVTLVYLQSIFVNALNDKLDLSKKQSDFLLKVFTG